MRHDGKVVIAGDGQVSVGPDDHEGKAKKVRRMHDGQVLAGFAGSAADGWRCSRSSRPSCRNTTAICGARAVELAKDWRTDRVLRRLEAMLVVADAERTLLISGTGDVIEPDDGVIAIGSGGPYALAAARALVRHASELTARRNRRGRAADRRRDLHLHQ